jgi:hypothetical protein
MKVALCLSGQVRNWLACYPLIEEKIITPYNADVFIHTWSKSENYNIPHCNVEDFSVYDARKDITYEFLNTYRPKKTQIDVPEYKTFRSKVLSNSRFYNTMMMWYSILKSNELRKEYEKENSINYDIIIRCRFDLHFEKFIIDKFETGTLYLPPNENIDNPFPEPMKNELLLLGMKYMPNDQFAYGSSKVMDYYASLYLYLKDYMDEQDNHPEAMMTHHWWNKIGHGFKIEVNESVLMKIKR